MLLEDFSSEPIAMCKILLYVESIEIHIAGENDMKRLAWLSVEDYAATQMELVEREDDLSKAGVTMLGNVDGKSMVEQMSPQFLEFVLDAYRSLKYRK